MPQKSSFDPRFHSLPSGQMERLSLSSRNSNNARNKNINGEEWSDQEREFFFGGCGNDNRDLEIAHRLQQEFYDEDRKAEEQDLEFAKLIQEEEQVRKISQNSPEVRQNFPYNDVCQNNIISNYVGFHEAEKKGEEESFALALKLNLEEQEKLVGEKAILASKRSKNDLDPHLNKLLDNLQMSQSQDEDRRIALRIQEIEGNESSNPIPDNNKVSSTSVPPQDVLAAEMEEEEFMRKMMLQVQQQEDEVFARNFQMQEEEANENHKQKNQQNSNIHIGTFAAVPRDTSNSSSLIGDNDEHERKPPARRRSDLLKLDGFKPISPTSDLQPILENPTPDETFDPIAPYSQERFISSKKMPTTTPKLPNKENNTPKACIPISPSVGITKKTKRNILKRFFTGKMGESPLKELNSPRTLTDPNGYVSPMSNPTRKRNAINPSHSPIVCDVCGEVAMHFLVALGKKFHLECFTCMGCCAPIKPSEPFAYSVNEDGEKFPLHRECHAELFGIKCTVCKETIPYGDDGTITYMKHPFFASEQMCPKHAKKPGRRCTGCNRFEPEDFGFLELHDAGRCLCSSCCRTVIVDSKDAQPLWDKVIHFFKHKLQITVWDNLQKVPVLVVGYETLNERLKHSAHSGSSQIMTRGLCLSEHQSGRKIELARVRYDKENGHFTQPNNGESGFTYFQIPDSNKANPDSFVTAILCLSGLPSDLAASVLAHEATHAWIKLHPRFDIKKPIPMMVEEGCCQLVANLFLSDGLEPARMDTFDELGPSDASLRQYFKFMIETDENEIYGTGFRIAAKVYAKIGIEALLSHVVMYREFPEV